MSNQYSHLLFFLLNRLVISKTTLDSNINASVSNGYWCEFDRQQSFQNWFGCFANKAWISTVCWARVRVQSPGIVIWSKLLPLQLFLHFIVVEEGVYSVSKGRYQICRITSRCKKKVNSRISRSRIISRSLRICVTLN